MKDSEKLDAGRESNEVELSAQDLLALSPAGAEAPTSASAACAEPGVQQRETHKASADTHRAPRTKRMSAAAVVLAVGAVAAAAAAVVVIVPNESALEPAQSAMSASSEPPLAESAPPEAEGPPVRFKNPFDETEVFEFPPGTSQEEARAAVADLLIMRAQERQALLEAKSKKRK